MFSLNEVFSSRGSSQVIPTQCDHEGGSVDLSYKCTMTVEANIQNANKKKTEKLEQMDSYMKTKLGYECFINISNNTIKISSIRGVRSADVLSYIRKHIDKNATEK